MAFFQLQDDGCGVGGGEGPLPAFFHSSHLQPPVLQNQDAQIIKASIATSNHTILSDAYMPVIMWYIIIHKKLLSSDWLKSRKAVQFKCNTRPETL